VQREPLWDEVERIDTSPARHGESSAVFLNRVAGDFWDQVRSVSEAWLSRVPDSAYRDLRSRLRSPLDRQSSAAFWELYLHETFVRAGFQVEVHPDVEGERRQPDFFVSRGDEAFYVEATAVFGANEDPGATARRMRLYDELNRIESPNFFLNVDVQDVGPRDLSTARLKRDVISWLRSLEPDAMRVSFAEGEGDRFEFAHDGWVIELRPMPITAEQRGKPHRPVGMYGPPEAHFIDDAGTLREAIADKGRAYGALGYPLLIAVNVATAFHDDHDTTNALYGTLRFRVNRWSDDGAAEPFRDRDGYWGAPPDWNHPGVAGLLLGKNISPWSAAKTSATLWPHPQSGTAVPLLSLWGSSALATDHIENRDPDEPAAQFFELRDGWPVGEPFPDD